MAEITLPVRADGDQPRARRVPNPATLNAGDVQTQRVQGDPGVAVPKGAFADGEGLVAASKGISAVGEDVYRAGLRQQRLQDANATTQTSLAYDNVSMQEWNRRQTEDDPTRPDFMKDYNEWLGKQAAQHVASLPEGVSDEARQKLTLSLATKQQTLTDAAGKLSLIANQQKAKDLIGAQTNQFAAMASRDPGSLENILAVGEEDLKAYQGTMTPDQFRDAQSRRRGAVAMASVVGHTQQGDYQSAAALIDSKKYDDVLDVPKMTAYVETQQRVQTAAAEAEERRADTAKEKGERQAGERAADNYIKQLTNDPTKVSARDIANDKSIPASQWRTREALIKMADAANAEDVSKTVKTYGPGFYDQYKRVHLPPGDPDRLTDPAELYPLATPTSDASGNLVAPPLTVSGVDKLKAEIQGKRTPEGETEATQKKTLLTLARSQLVHPLAGSGNFKDSKGEEIFLKWLAEAMPAYDKGRAAGKTASQLTDPDSPDYVGKSIGSMKRTMAQIAADIKAENGAATPPPDLSTAANIIDAYRSSKITKEAMETELITRGFARAPSTAAAAPQISVPIR